MNPARITNHHCRVGICRLITRKIYQEITIRNYNTARELERYAGDYQRAFGAYETFLKPVITKKQDSAAGFSRIFMPAAKSHMWLRRLVIRLVFSRLLIGFELSGFGSRSALKNYD